MNLHVPGECRLGRRVTDNLECELPTSEAEFPVFPRSIESPNLGFCSDVILPHLLEDDLGQLSDLEPEPEVQNWQHTVGKDVVAGLTQREVERQEVINGEHLPCHLPPFTPHLHSCFCGVGEISQGHLMSDLLSPAVDKSALCFPKEWCGVVCGNQVVALDTY